MRNVLRLAFVSALSGACSLNSALECGPGTVNREGICTVLDGATQADVAPDLAAPDADASDRGPDVLSPDVPTSPDGAIDNGAPAPDAAIDSGALTPDVAIDVSVAEDVPADRALTDIAETGTTDTGADARVDMDVRASDAGTPADTGVVCGGRHPLVSGTRRYCESGDCYCSDSDACFASPVATACCRTGVVCASADAGPVDSAVTCSARHPLVMGTRRYCESGDCYCSDPDACFAAGVATACCRGAVVCSAADAGPGDAAVTCTRQHPLVMGTRRYCAPGQCFCASPDACLPTGTPGSCCESPVVCF